MNDFLTGFELWQEDGNIMHVSLLSLPRFDSMRVSLYFNVHSKLL